MLLPSRVDVVDLDAEFRTQVLPEPTTNDTADERRRLAVLDVHTLSTIFFYPHGDDVLGDTAGHVLRVDSRHKDGGRTVDRREDDLIISPCFSIRGSAVHGGVDRTVDIGCGFWRGQDCAVRHANARFVC